MDQRQQHPKHQLRLAQAAGLALSTAIAGVQAQQAPAPAAPGLQAEGWQQCSRLSVDPAARLACFDAWAQSQPAGTSSTPVTQAAPAVAAPTALAAAPTESPTQNCKAGHFSSLSRFWELENASDCGTFTLRGYRPISLSLTSANSVNRQPTSGNPANNASTAQDYQHGETRIQLSVRTKLAQNMLTQGDGVKKDSIWFGYTQQSYWQVFNKELSRPFRNTDHEPEVVYIYPSDATLPFGWRLRYSGAALTHQSNGQSLPLSRSWNRVSLMAGMEKGNDFTLTGRIWKRVQEKAAVDDNPNITDYVGRAELTGAWNFDAQNTFLATARHALRSNGRGSLRLEWLRAIGTSSNPTVGSGLRFHTQLFTGYGDSLIDFNRRRTVLNVGLSLVDF